MKRKHTLYSVIGVCTVLAILFFATLSAWIGFYVEDKCVNAKKIYRIENCTEALIAQLDDENNSYRERNDAIWSLGQLGDKSALPAIEKYYTGDMSQTKYDLYLSQYELGKAIKNLRDGELNIPRILRLDFFR